MGFLWYGCSLGFARASELPRRSRSGSWRELGHRPRMTSASGIGEKDGVSMCKVDEVDWVG